LFTFANITALRAAKTLATVIKFVVTTTPRRCNNKQDQSSVVALTVERKLLTTNACVFGNNNTANFANVSVPLEKAKMIISPKFSI
jgi:hypothetical protein